VGARQRQRDLNLRGYRGFAARNRLEGYPPFPTLNVPLIAKRWTLESFAFTSLTFLAPVAPATQDRA